MLKESTKGICSEVNGHEDDEQPVPLAAPRRRGRQQVIVAPEVARDLRLRVVVVVRSSVGRFGSGDHGILTVFKKPIAPEFFGVGEKSEKDGGQGVLKCVDLGVRQVQAHLCWCCYEARRER